MQCALDPPETSRTRFAAIESLRGMYHHSSRASCAQKGVLPCRDRHHDPQVGNPLPGTLRLPNEWEAPTVSCKQYKLHKLVAHTDDRLEPADFSIANNGYFCTRRFARRAST